MNKYKIIKCRIISYIVLLVFITAGYFFLQNSKISEKKFNPYPYGYFETKINELQHANIIEDVKESIKKGDKRFLVCMGFGGIIPGVPYWNEYLYNKYGTRILDSTGDIIFSEAQKNYKNEAVKYAEVYNKLLWSKTEGSK